ncbi:APC family permease [Spiroplasma endosymbiont of Aspidapion aeneum]|uniref:APC family permease n=1 Tax=Spiroplasma endosymbiont of Aspidapion aeneum TaxID=3066276 RepID=UPI00313E00B6
MKNLEDDKKFNLVELIWLGFNYTCGIAFTAVFATLMIGSTGALGLGGHMIWIFLVEGLIAGTCAWSFAKLSNIHKPGNGAAYIYVRTTFGRFAGWMISFMQYTTLPIIVTSQIVSIVRLNFVGSNTFLDQKNWLNIGVWANLFWDLIGIFIYCAACCVVFLSMRLIKKFLNWSSYIKWGSSLLLVITLIIVFAMNGTTVWDKNMSDNSKLTLSSFSVAFTSCFFFFLGFETFSTMGKNVMNPEKNIGKAIIWIMGLAIIFYVIITALFLGCLLSYSSNPNLQIFEGLKKHGSWIYYCGVILMLICTVSLKLNAGMQNSLYSGAILEPFAKEGLISTKYQELNKDGIATKASLLNLFITIIFALIWLIIPDIIQGCLNSNDAVFSFSAITGEASMVMLFIYLAVIIVSIKLAFTKKMKTNWFEKAIWIFATIFIIFQIVEFFIGIGNDISTSSHSLSLTITSKDVIDGATSNGQSLTQYMHKIRNSAISTLLSSILEVGFIIGVFVFGVIWYRIKYLPIYKKRLKEDPKLQEELDMEFSIIPLKENYVD